MKKYKLHQWLPFLFALVIFTTCSKKKYPNNNAETEDKYENVAAANDSYTPPPVISISDEQSKSNKDGEMYYDNAYGYRYWRFCDGKYYLDTKYESGAKPDKKTAKKNNKKQTKKNRNKSEANDYAHE